MIHVMVVDDETPARDELKYLLEGDSEIKVTAEASDGMEAIELTRIVKPQVVFLDVQMPEMDGFQVAEILLRCDRPPLMVFATAFDQYAVKAFEHAALDYLLKPINPLRLEKTLKRIKSAIRTESDSWQSKVEEVLTQLREPKILDRFPVLENEKVILLNPEEIIYLESQGRGSKIVTSGKVYQSNHPLTELEDRLKGYLFLRTHKSYLVNLNAIREVIPWFNNTMVLRLQGTSDEVPVSRTYLKDFKSRVNL